VGPVQFRQQQPLLRILDGLTALTGEPKYRRAAEEATRHALQHLATPNGLLYWGGHLAWTSSRTARSASTPISTR